MPDTISPEYQITPRPEHPLNPHFTQERGISERSDSDRCFFNWTASNSCNSLLTHRVPSASLYLEDIMAQWPLSISRQSASSSRYSGEGTKRSSTATLVDFGDWISGQSSYNRPPSLLPPAPQLIRLPSSYTCKVECRLSSPTTPVTKRTTSDRATNQEQLHCLSAQLQEVSFSAESTSTPPTRPITPVPSLTISNQSRPSCDFSETSPCTAIYSPKDNPLSSPFNPSDRHMMPTRKPPDQIIYGPRIRNISPPISSPLLYQEDRQGWAHLSADPSRYSSYLPFRPVPNPEPNGTLLRLPQSSQDPQEVSFIEWDDYRRGDSALNRIKKSFTDLRAAERCIAEASTRSKAEAAKGVQDSRTFLVAQRSSDPRKTSITSTFVALEQDSTHVSAASKLRKRASAKNISPSVRSVHSIAPPMPLSTGKRKRKNTMSSQQSQELGKKKPKTGMVGKFVRRLLGAKKEH